MDPPPHVSIPIGNIRVFFPFQPYKPQREFIESVVEALSTKQHALLESPTGTGKTLSLLCSTLGWLQSQGGPQGLIYYTSRTHMQLAQAAKEMKRTAYAKIPAVVIGSRAKMCLNDEVRHQAGDHLINRACRNAIAKNSCSFYTNYEQKLEVLDHNSVHDIEDLCQFGRRSQCCPYYAGKKIAETKASLIFMPYNYLLDPSIRKGFQLKLENSIIIFDEAHNIEGALKDSVSGSFSLMCLSNIQESCQKLPAKIHEALNKEKHGFTRAGFNSTDKQNGVVDEFAKTKNNKKADQEPKVNPIEELASKLTNEKLQQVERCADKLKSEIKSLEMDKTSSVEKVFHIMKQSGIQYTTSDSIITTLDSMASFWSMAGVMSPVLVARYVTSISNLSHVVSLLYPTTCLSLTRQANNEKALSDYYTAYLKGTYETSNILRRGELKDWDLNMWCLLPAVGLKRIIDDNCINGPRSLIVTSGTLAPMRSMAKELETNFKIMKEFEHVISDNQLKIMIIGKSPNMYSLESHFQAAIKDEYPIALGKTLVPLFQVLPFGTLIFFQSYTLLNRVVKVWREKSTIWRDMNAASSIYIESSTQDSFLSDVASYKKTIDNSRKAVFFGVFRGKLSEGVNFDGNHCRSVILTGLPFPSVTDPKVISTRKFQEKRGGPESGKIWYSQQMLRALNQSIGRVIRSKSDFGMLFLCDPRFKGYKYSLSAWTRNFFPVNDTPINLVEQEVKQFFNNHGVIIAETASENCGAFDISLSRSSRPAPVEKPTSNNTRSITAPVPDESATLADSFDSSDNVPAQVQDKTAAMLSSYRVSKETYAKAQEKRNVSRKQTETESGISSKRPKMSTMDAFAAICSAIYEPVVSQSISDGSQNTQNTNDSKEYSILEQAKDHPNKGSTYKCYICKNEARDATATNCRCARVGCLKCVRILNRERCGDCKELILAKKMKPRIFKSAFFKQEKFSGNK